MTDYVALEEGPFGGLPLGRPLKAAVGALGMLLMGATGWGIAQADRVLHFSDKEKSVTTSPFTPEKGAESVLAQPGAPSALQGLAPPTEERPTAVFIYSGYVPPELSANSKSVEGWIYGARLFAPGRRGEGIKCVVTGFVEDIVKGRLYIWPGQKFEDRLAMTDEMHSYDPKRPNEGEYGRRMAYVVKGDGTSVRAYWYYDLTYDQYLQPVTRFGSSNAVIGTHDGSFHCDEALAVYLLRQTPQYKDAKVVRTRDKEVLNKLPVLVDVGGVYDASKGRFDHHQRGFSETFSDAYSTKLSSAGLVYKHYGKSIIATMAKLDVKSTQVELLYQHIYKTFVEAVDAIDNGVSQYDGEANYISKTDLSARVAKLNPGWMESATDGDRLERFHRAIAMVGEDFTSMVEYAIKSWLPAGSFIQEAYEYRFHIHSSGQVMVLNTYADWKEHLDRIEKEQVPLRKPILYVLYPDTNGGWRLQAVSERFGSFASRKPLPEAWRGKNDQELERATGVAGSLFVHSSGFIGGHKTKEGATQLAILALGTPAAAASSRSSTTTAISTAIAPATTLATTPVPTTPIPTTTTPVPTTTSTTLPETHTPAKVTTLPTTPPTTPPTIPPETSTIPPEIATIPITIPPPEETTTHFVKTRIPPKATRPPNTATSAAVRSTRIPPRTTAPPSLTPTTTRKSKFWWDL
eukprot:gb/GEZN01002700.1/.p1 GENE.gb/GEZN01002700.1/~~gb/GEZN01002700.1/.p1  ORF type:complete len:689 (+),score=87.74 gb/GEZN01002700.1/:95-2161(+)